MHSLFLPSRIDRLSLPEHARELGTSTRLAEGAIEAVPGPLGTMDLTGADTGRFPPPDWALDTFTVAASGKGATYTPARGDAGVREVLARSVSGLLSLHVDPAHELILTPGTQAGLFLAIGSIVEAGDTVVVPDPDYLLTERICRFYGADVVRIPLVLAANGEAVVDVDGLSDIFARVKPRLLIFTNPNNPTGAVFAEDVLTEIARAAMQHDVFVLADELYTRLLYDEHRPTHMASIVEGMKDRTLTLLGPSKTESMSGYRVGAAVGPAVLIDRMADLLYTSAMRCPAYAQHLLARWLTDDVHYVEKRIMEYQELRDLAVQRINDMPGVSVNSPGGTSYVFPAFTGIDVDDVALCSELKRNGVIVSPGFQFGPESHGHVRICFAQQKSNLIHALDVIEKTVLGLGA